MNEAEREFETEELYEMEASGFISAALRFSTADLVHCFKIVSDNLTTDLSSLKLSDVEDLVDAHCATISELVRQLTEVRDSLVSQF
ncbi:MAG: hypothetical protein QF473_38670 [Planctomycetota bacterium]|nr:hypothetical protein [Planctomycetota bacterium]